MKRDYTRPLRIVHNLFQFEPDDTYERKCQKIRDRLQFLKDFGYGGIVTNVQEGNNYLNDKEELQLMTEKAKICRELGLRMWIYDEDKYPSGAARTKTVDANPDFQALGLAMVWNVVAPGETFTQSLPQGHTKILAAVSYRMESDTPTDEELLTPYARYQGEPVSFVNDTDKNLLCLAFCTKPAYEGTHAVNNSCYHRHYIDVSNPDAIAEFINNTYRPYTQVLGEYYSPAFGDEGENSVVEAIFTDEPSYMGVYINSYREQRITLHPVDRSMPLYMTVNWGLHVANRFRSTYGYRLEDELTALFLGHSEHFCRVRHDYYQLMSDLYEKAFFAKLSAGVKRAGSEAELIAILCPNGTLLTGDHKGIAMAENAEHVLLVNKDEREKKVCWHGACTSLMDAYDGSLIALEKSESGVSFTIGAGAAYILKK